MNEVIIVLRTEQFHLEVYLSLLQFDGSLLHEAVASSSSAIVRMLLDAKADVDACSKVRYLRSAVYS